MFRYSYTSPCCSTRSESRSQHSWHPVEISVSRSHLQQPPSNWCATYEDYQGWSCCNPQAWLGGIPTPSTSQARSDSCGSVASHYLATTSKSRFHLLIKQSIIQSTAYRVKRLDKSSISLSLPPTWSFRLINVCTSSVRHYISTS